MNLRALPLPSLVAIAIAGGAAGVLLGNSAVGEIDPVFYSEPETRFHADLSPYRSPSWAQNSAQIAGETALAPGELGDGCAGCRAYPIEYIPERDPAIDGYAASAWEPVEEASAQYAVEQAASAAEPDPRLVTLERYASYRVSQDEPERVRAPAAAAVEVAAEGEAVALGM